MNKFIVLAAVVAVVAAEAPAHVGLTSFSSLGGSSGSGLNEYVDEALLARVGDLISRGGDGTGTPQGSEGRNLDASILSRVSGSLGDGGSRASSTAYGPPSRSAPSMLGHPEPAERIAEFELEATRSQQGGYEQAPPPQYGAPAPAPAPSGGYGAPSRSSGGPISLGRPEPAQRVDDFSINDAPAPSRNNGGYN